ncbi:MAG: hypothetical protein MZV49_16565 [Rhodopseudomonas palustris]|nr:hypothetical protein [Rhodopseudomonas palustris]
MSLMSAPAMKLDLAEVITTPLTAGSAAIWSMHSARSALEAGVEHVHRAGRPRRSGSRAMPSASTE